MASIIDPSWHARPIDPVLLLLCRPAPCCCLSVLLPFLLTAAATMCCHCVHALLLTHGAAWDRPRLTLAGSLSEEDHEAITCLLNGRTGNTSLGAKCSQRSVASSGCLVALLSVAGGLGTESNQPEPKWPVALDPNPTTLCKDQLCYSRTTTFCLPPAKRLVEVPPTTSHN